MGKGRGRKRVVNIFTYSSEPIPMAVTFLNNNTFMSLTAKDLEDFFFFICQLHCLLLILVLTNKVSKPFLWEAGCLTT